MYPKIDKHLWNLLVKFQLDPTVGFKVMLNSVKLNGINFYAKIRIWPYLVCITRLNRIDTNLMITWSRNPLAKTSIPGKPGKSGLIGVWHKDNLYLGTSTIGNGDPRPTNIDSRTRSIRMMPRRQLFFDKSFFQFFREPRKGNYPTNT
jgi:hypothetical protein